MEDAHRLLVGERGTSKGNTDLTAFFFRGNLCFCGPLAPSISRPRAQEGLRHAHSVLDLCSRSEGLWRIV